MEERMVKTRAITKTAKKRKFVDLSFECDDKTLKRLNAIADLAAVTRDQVVSVILAMYIFDIKSIEGDGFKLKKRKSKNVPISLGEK
jgi:hypothetical protein